MPTRVLVADDEPHVREALSAVVASDPGLELVGVAEDADEAIELARLHRPDVALVDFKMPGGGGPRAVREIARCSPRTRAIALSAYEDRGSVFRMLRAGAVGYLVKGVPVEEILETIARAARGQAVLAAEVTADVVAELAGQLEREAGEEERRREVVAQVRRCLEDGRLAMCYQPIVDLEDGHAVGYEALARFRLDPPLPPDRWFAEAAAVGLLTDLELAALRVALQGLERLPSGAFLSVNVFPGTLTAPSALEVLAGVPVERVVLEITEHAQVDDYEALNAALVELRARGGRVAIDDAGAGFASLRHVLQLSPDMVKLDMSLIRGIERERAARALASALISFARELGQTVVAEGIESGQELAALRVLGVRYGQGFYLGSPGDLPR